MSESGQTPSDHTYTPADQEHTNAFERLWNPHRMTYITDRKSLPTKEHLLRDLPLLEDKEALIIARGETVYAVLNLYPYNPGHSMIVPYREIGQLEDLTKQESAELMEFTQKLIRVIKKVSAPHAFNVGFNVGPAAGGSISEHVHQHIVPRWTGDSSVITVLSNTKVMPTLLSETRDLFAAAWQEL